MVELEKVEPHHVQPLVREARNEPFHLFVGQHAIDLCSQHVWLAKRAGSGERHEPVVGRAAPEEVGEPIGQFNVGERHTLGAFRPRRIIRGRFAVGGGAAAHRLGDVKETRRGKHERERRLERLDKRLAGRPPLRVVAHEPIDVARLGGPTPKRSFRKPLNHGPGLGLARLRPHVNAAKHEFVGPRRPLFDQWPLPLDPVHPQAAIKADVLVQSLLLVPVEVDEARDLHVPVAPPLAHAKEVAALFGDGNGKLEHLGLLDRAGDAAAAEEFELARPALVALHAQFDESRALGLGWQQRRHVDRRAVNRVGREADAHPHEILAGWGISRDLNHLLPDFREHARGRGRILLVSQQRKLLAPSNPFPGIALGLVVEPELLRRLARSVPFLGLGNGGSGLFEFLLHPFVHILLDLAADSFLLRPPGRLLGRGVTRVVDDRLIQSSAGELPILLKLVAGEEQRRPDRVERAAVVISRQVARIHLHVQQFADRIHVFAAVEPPHRDRPASISEGLSGHHNLLRKRFQKRSLLVIRRLRRVVRRHLTGIDYTEHLLPPLSGSNLTNFKRDIVESHSAVGVVGVMAIDAIGF